MQRLALRRGLMRAENQRWSCVGKLPGPFQCTEHQGRVIQAPLPFHNAPMQCRHCVKRWQAGDTDGQPCTHEPEPAWHLLAPTCLGIPLPEHLKRAKAQKGRRNAHDH